jgi:hypothetical protein
VREKDYAKIKKDIEVGRATTDDFEFEGGKPVKRKIRSYIDMKGMKEEFGGTRKSRMLSPDSVENTLVPDRENPDTIHKIPVTEEYVFPDWYVESGILFDTRVDSKRMITNKKIRDVQALQAVIQNFMLLLQVDTSLGQRVDIDKLFNQILRLAELDEEDVLKGAENTETEQILKMMADQKAQVLSQPNNVAQINPTGLNPIGAGQVASPIAQQGAAQSPLQSL